MPDIALISAALTSLKAATDIVKFLRESDLSLEKAEFKFKLAELIGALADTKIELVEVQDALAAKDKRIAELEEAFEARGTLTRLHDAYYAVTADGKPTGAPFCLRCWEVDHRRRPLVHDAKDHGSRVCPACGHRYDGRLTREISPENANA